MVIFIMFRIVGIQIVQGKAVMTGQEIYTGVVSCIQVIVLCMISSVQIMGAADTVGCRTVFPAVPLQVPSERITVSSVPFSPAVAGRKTSYLIEPSRVPCLGNKLHITENRVIGDQLQERRICQGRSVCITSEDSCKVKSEAVDTIVDSPVAQTLQNIHPDHRVVAVQCIAASTEIIIISVWSQHIAELVVKAFEGEDRSVFIPFGSVVKDNIQDDLNTIFVQLLDHFL